MLRVSGGWQGEGEFGVVQFLVVVLLSPNLPTYEGSSSVFLLRSSQCDLNFFSFLGCSLISTTIYLPFPLFDFTFERI